MKETYHAEGVPLEYNSFNLHSFNTSARAFGRRRVVAPKSEFYGFGGIFSVLAPPDDGRSLYLAYDGNGCMANNPASVGASCALVRRIELGPNGAEKIVVHNLTSPKQMALDPQGRLHVVEEWPEQVTRWDPTTGEQAVVLQERQMERMRVEMQDQMDAKITQLEARLSGGVADGGATLASAVRGLVARLTETPTNFHQATVFFLAADAPEDAAMARRAPLLYAGSLAMVGLQSATAAGVLVGTVRPACATSDQCGAGTWCRVGAQGRRCDFCGETSPLDIGNLTRVAEVCTMPYAEHVGMDGIGVPTAYPDTSVASWCEACVRNDGTVDPLTWPSLCAGNLAAMASLDDVAYAFAAFIVAFTVVGELKDIELCSMAVAHAGDKLSKGWRRALSFLLWMRRWVFLPGLVISVPTLVLFKGGDALSVCLNTVAILFLCDIDNIAFDLALGERVRARVEDAGHVELDDAETAALARTKAVHVALLVLAVVGAVWSGSVEALLLTFFAFLLGGVAEAFVPGASAAETAKRVGKVLGAWLLGMVGFVVLSDIA